MSIETILGWFSTTVKFRKAEQKSENSEVWKMMRLKGTIINLMVFPIIHQFLKIFYLIAVLFEVLL